MLEINAELKEKMLKNAKTMLSREVLNDGTVNCTSKQITCKECPLARQNNNDDLSCLQSGRSLGKKHLQNWYDNNKPKESKVEKLQTIDTSKWQWMMVKAYDRGTEYRRICLFSINGLFICVGEKDEYAFLYYDKVPVHERLCSWPFGRVSEVEEVKKEESKQYRIKTEQEFKEEFGADWRGRCDFPDGMDFLFGDEVEGNEPHKKSGWHINSRMVTDKPLPTSKKQANTALDVMWWGGVRKVFSYQRIGIIYPISYIDSSDTFNNKVFNELHLVDGHAQIKHEKWLKYNELVVE